MSGTVAASIRALYITLRHAAIPLQVVIEDDCVGGGLSAKNISALYIIPPQVTSAAAQGLSDWVRTGGGRVVSVAGGGLLDERNQTNKAMHTLLGLSTAGIFTGNKSAFNDTIWFCKQDLAYATMLDRVTLADASVDQEPVSVKGQKLIIDKFEAPKESVSSRVLGHFEDGTVAAAAVEFPAAGRAVFMAFPVGLAYFDPAMPKRPVDRGSTDLNFNHFLPTDFEVGARRLAIAPIADLDAVRPVVPSDELVEAGIIAHDSSSDKVLVLVNWRGSPVQNLTLTLGPSVVPELSSMRLSRTSGQDVLVQGQSTLRVPLLDVADAIVMRLKSDDAQASRLYVLLDRRNVIATRNATLVHGPVRKHAQNPVLRETLPWERRFDNMQPNVFFDTDRWRVWYSSFTGCGSDTNAATCAAHASPCSGRYPLGGHSGKTAALLYAESATGVSWSKPKLGLVSKNGSDTNIILDFGQQGTGLGTSVFLDTKAPPESRWKLFGAGQGTDNTLVLGTSGDGLNFQMWEVNGTQSRLDTHKNAVFDSRTQRWIGLVRCIPTAGHTRPGCGENATSIPCRLRVQCFTESDAEEFNKGTGWSRAMPTGLNTSDLTYQPDSLVAWEYPEAGIFLGIANVFVKY